MSLDDVLLDRYARHIVLKEIGGAGQMQLMAAHVTVIGAGGIGRGKVPGGGVGPVTVHAPAVCVGSPDGGPGQSGTLAPCPGHPPGFPRHRNGRIEAAPHGPWGTHPWKVHALQYAATNRLHRMIDAGGVGNSYIFVSRQPQRLSTGLIQSGSRSRHNSC